MSTESGEREQKWGDFVTEYDGAYGHKHVEPLIHVEAMDKYGLDVQLNKQTPQMTQLNVVDCGIFCSIQKMVIAGAPPTCDASIDVVDKI